MRPSTFSVTARQLINSPSLSKCLPLLSLTHNRDKKSYGHKTAFHTSEAFISA